MTLAIVWRSGDIIKFASDSRLSSGGYTVDCAIKIIRVPYCVYAMGEGPTRPGPLITSGNLGMVAAGSAVAALILKESLSEAMSSMRTSQEFAPPVNMTRFADYMFCAYRSISNQICSQLGPRGLTSIIWAGFCDEQKRLRAFKMETDADNVSSISEILNQMDTVEMIGNGMEIARPLVAQARSDREILEALQKVIDDPAVSSVGGSVQFAWLTGKKFQAAGIARAGQSAHYWRGGLDLNSPDFMNTGLIPTLAFLILDHDTRDK